MGNGVGKIPIIGNLLGAADDTSKLFHELVQLIPVMVVISGVGAVGYVVTAIKK